MSLRIFNKFFYFLSRACIVLIILFAVCIGLVRLVLSEVVHYKNFAYVGTHVLHEPVQVGHLSTDWYGFEPRVHLDNVVVLDKQTKQPILNIDHLVIQMNLFSSLVHWELLPDQITLDGAQLSVSRDTQGAYYIKGLPHKEGEKHVNTKLRSVLFWILTQSKLQLTHIRINWLDQLSMSHIHFVIHNNASKHQLSGVFRLGDAGGSGVQVIAALDKSVTKFSDISGKAYVSASHLNKIILDQVMAVFPKLKKTSVTDIDGDFKLWLTIHKNHLKKLHADYSLARLKIGNRILQNASGRVAWVAQKNSATLALFNKNGSIMLPHYFVNPVEIGQLIVQGTMNRDEAGLHFNTQTLALKNKNITFNGHLAVTKHAHESPLIDLAAGFAVRDISQLRKLVPTPIIKPHLDVWLRQAFLKGSIDQGTMILRGALHKHFFDHHNGLLELSAHLHHAMISFAKTWPVVHDGDIIFTVHNRTLKAASAHVMTGNNVVDKFSMVIPDVRKSVLSIKLHSALTLSNAWDYVESTPLYLATVLKDFKFSGPAQFNFSLVYPLHKKPHNDVVTQGEIITKNGSLFLPQWNLPLTAINGTIRFHNSQLSANKVAAQLFSKPAVIDIATVSEKSQPTLEITTKGTLIPRVVASHFSLPFICFFSGASPFTARLVVHNHLVAGGTDLHVTSNLKGIKTQILPAPFSKTPETSRPFALDISIAKTRPLFFRVHYGTFATASLVYHRAADGLHFSSGNIQLDNIMAPYLAQPGLVISGHLPELKWPAWRVFFARLKAMSSQFKSKNNALSIRALNLSIDNLFVAGGHYKKLHFKLDAVKDKWLAAINSHAIVGHATIPIVPGAPWKLNFDKLHLAHQKKTLSQKIDPTLLPAIDLTVHDIMFSGKAYNLLRLQTAKVPKGLLISKLELESKTTDISSQGYWKIAHNKQQTYLKGVVSTSNLGDFIKQWTPKKMISKGRGRLRFKAWWENSPLHVDLKSLIGSLHYQFLEGSMIALDKSSETKIGLGRILNILSPASLLKRLEFNFSDLSNKGLWFDKFSGDWTFAKGYAATKDTSFLGPVADITLHGKLGLLRHPSNLWFKVVPKLTSSAPLIATLIGGPVAGIVTWVANKIVGPGIDKLSGSTYHVTGPLKKLNVQKVSV